MRRLRQPQLQARPLIPRLRCGGAHRAEEHGAERARGGREQGAHARELLRRAVLALHTHKDIAELIEARVEVLERGADLALLAAHERDGHGGAHVRVAGRHEAAALRRWTRHGSARGWQVVCCDALFWRKEHAYTHEAMKSCSGGIGRHRRWSATTRNA